MFVMPPRSMQWRRVLERVRLRCWLCRLHGQEPLVPALRYSRGNHQAVCCCCFFCVVTRVRIVCCGRSLRSNALVALAAQTFNTLGSLQELYAISMSSLVFQSIGADTCRTTPSARLPPGPLLASAPSPSCLFTSHIAIMPLTSRCRYLSNNYLTWLDPATFTPLTSLQTLLVHGAGMYIASFASGACRETC